MNYKKNDGGLSQFINLGDDNMSHKLISTYVLNYDTNYKIYLNWPK